MVTARLPFEADTPLAVMLKKNTKPLPRPTLYVRNLPSSVENVMIKVLARDPKNRYGTMTEFANALERLNRKAETLETLTDADMVAATLASTVESPIPEVSEKDTAKGWFSIAIPIGIGVAVFLAGFGVVFLWRSVFPPQASTEPPASQTLLPEDTPEPLPSPSLTPEWTPTIAPTSMPNGGKWIAFNSRMNGSADIYLVDTNGNDLTRLTMSSAHDFYPSWSPDGERIVYQTNDGGDQEVAIIDVSSKRVTSLTHNTCDDWAPTWSPDGDWIAFYSDCDGDRNIYKMHTDGSGRTQLTSTSGSNSWFPSWSPDGKKITFTSNRSGKYHIYVMNSNGGNVRDLAEGCISYFSPDGKKILYGVYCDDTDDLLVMDADGSNQTQLTNGYECKNATWSPDGTQIIFQLSKTTKDGPFAIYIMSLEKPQRSNWILLTDYDVNGGSPVWQP